MAIPIDFDLTRLISHTFPLEQAAEAIVVCFGTETGLHESCDSAVGIHCSVMSRVKESTSRSTHNAVCKTINMAAEMNAAVLYGKEDVRIERLPVPKRAQGRLLSALPPR